MSSRLRTEKPRISFFAFQDIIASVTGVLILVTLILASHLERITDSESVEAPEALQRHLAALLKEQTELELQSRVLTDSLALAQAQPDVAKLNLDIAKLNTRIKEEQQRLDSAKTQSERQRQASIQRDATLGLTGLRNELEKTRSDILAIADNARTALTERQKLEKELKNAETILLKIKSQTGQMWLIPDEKATSKEPILAIVSREGLTLERFDKPESRRVFSSAESFSGFSRFLETNNATSQYVVFYLRPSGIALFNQVSERAKEKHFEIGFDALDESTQIHFTKPPDFNYVPQITVATSETTNSSGIFPPPTAAVTPEIKTASTNTPPPSAPVAPAATPPAKKLGWWQRLLRAVGLY